MKCKYCGSIVNQTGKETMFCKDCILSIMRSQQMPCNIEFMCGSFWFRLSSDFDSLR